MSNNDLIFLSIKKIIVLLRVVSIILGGGGLAYCSYRLQQEGNRPLQNSNTKPAEPIEEGNSTQQTPDVKYVIKCHPPIKPEENGDPLVDILHTINSDLKGDDLQRKYVKQAD